MSTKKTVLSMAGTLVLGVAIGGTLMYNDDVYHSVKDAINGGATQNAVGDIGAITQVNINSMDLETALMMVQNQRASLLEDQLKSQLEAVQAKNDQITKLNEVMVGVTAQLGTLSSAAASQTVTVPADLLAKIKAAGLTAQVATKADLEKFREQVKSMIDAASNSQQMDMLRLQSLTNKRNEAFDVMTNFVKKMQDSRSSIIGNMR
ncbi:hypothetical protein D7Z26_24480 [Cohnella endophytica]|uniref:Uncharacterized protein n=1 Tax=Cohnella endophytica TaxID=2419778 RepID=A0A494X964_9BACL|nr:hypothetical protein [Cohnella endophytica]RKP46762.1 hypothetical protein D7Z26_24480 [Cohnella endophytica]